MAAVAELGSLGHIARMTNFHINEWIWTLAVGLPILATVAVLRWRQSQTSRIWRLVLCFIVACVITPYIFKDESADVHPAVSLLPLTFVAGRYAFVVFLSGAVPISVVAGALFFLWSAIIRRRRKHENRVA